MPCHRQRQATVADAYFTPEAFSVLGQIAARTKAELDYIDAANAVPAETLDITLRRRSAAR
jgi:hypothetical protein